MSDLERYQRTRPQASTPRDTELDAHFGANHNAAFRDKNCKNGAAREENCVPDTASGLK